MATGDAKESKEIPPGTKVVCTTGSDEQIEGEVLAFDYGTKVIIISILFSPDSVHRKLLCLQILVKW